MRITGLATLGAATLAASLGCVHPAPVDSCITLDRIGRIVGHLDEVLSYFESHEEARTPDRILEAREGVEARVLEILGEEGREDLLFKACVRRSLNPAIECMRGLRSSVAKESTESQPLRELLAQIRNEVDDYRQLQLRAPAIACSREVPEGSVCPPDQRIRTIAHDTGYPETGRLLDLVRRLDDRFHDDWAHCLRVESCVRSFRRLLVEIQENEIVTLAALGCAGGNPSALPSPENPVTDARPSDRAVPALNPEPIADPGDADPVSAEAAF